MNKEEWEYQSFRALLRLIGGKEDEMSQEEQWMGESCMKKLLSRYF